MKKSKKKIIKENNNKKKKENKGNKKNINTENKRNISSIYIFITVLIIISIILIIIFVKTQPTKPIKPIQTIPIQTPTIPIQTSTIPIQTPVPTPHGLSPEVIFFIVGSCIGFVVLVIIIIMIFVTFFKKKQKNNEYDENKVKQIWDMAGMSSYTLDILEEETNSPDHIMIKTDGSVIINNVENFDPVTIIEHIKITLKEDRLPIKFQFNPIKEHVSSAEVSADGNCFFSTLAYQIRTYYKTTYDYLNECIPHYIFPGKFKNNNNILNLERFLRALLLNKDVKANLGQDYKKTKDNTLDNILYGNSKKDCIGQFTNTIDICDDVIEYISYILDINITIFALTVVIEHKTRKHIQNINMDVYSKAGHNISIHDITRLDNVIWTVDNFQEHYICTQDQQQQQQEQQDEQQKEQQKEQQLNIDAFNNSLPLLKNSIFYLICLNAGHYVPAQVKQRIL